MSRHGAKFKRSYEDAHTLLARRAEELWDAVPAVRVDGERFDAWRHFTALEQIGHEAIDLGDGELSQLCLRMLVAFASLSTTSAPEGEESVRRACRRLREYGMVDEEYAMINAFNYFYSYYGKCEGGPTDEHAAVG